MPGLEAAVASHKLPVSGKIPLTVVLDGKPHALQMGPDQRVLDVALAAAVWTCLIRARGRLLHLPCQSHGRQCAYGQEFRARNLEN